MTFFRRILGLACLVSLLLAASELAGQAPNQSIIVLSREGRRTLVTSDVQGHAMVGLDDVAAMFQLAIRDDAAARAVTVTYKTQTIVLTPDQTLASLSGRLVSLPAPLTRQGRRWLVPVEFISRALAPIYDARLDLRPASRLLIVGDLRVPHVTVNYDETGGVSRVTLEATPKTGAAVSQDTGRLLVRFDADALDAALTPPPANSLATAVRAAEPNVVQIDLGARFASFRSSAPVSAGASSQLVIELVSTAAPESSSAGATPAVPSTVIPPAAAAPAPADLPVFGAANRASIRTIVIDPGHGADEIGVKGPGGRMEKDVVLAVARRAKAAIETRLGIRVLLTRDGDTMVDANSRVAIANNNKADLFISLHANGSPRPATRGATIYFLNLDRFGEEARRQAQADREVLPVFGGGSREFSLVDWELAQAAHVQDSESFAGMIEQRLRASAGVTTVSVQKAGMRGLAGANMPAVLIEMGYLSNPDEEKRLASPEFENGAAQALTEAVIAFRDHLDAPAQPTQPATQQ